MPLAPRLPALLVPNPTPQPSSSSHAASTTSTSMSARTEQSAHTSTSCSPAQLGPSTPTTSSADQSPPSTPSNSSAQQFALTPTNNGTTAQDPALQARDALQAAYTLAMPSPVRKTASRSALAAENDQLRALLKAAGIELQKDYAQMVLMNRENENMCQQLHAKKNKTKRTYTTGKARLMTSDEMAQVLLHDLHKKQVAELHSELRKTVFTAMKKANSQAKNAEKAERAAAKETEKATRAAEKATKAAERAVEKQRKAAEKEAAKAVRALARGGGVEVRVARAAAVAEAGVEAGLRDEESSERSGSSEEAEPDDPVVDANPEPSATDDKSSDEEDDERNPFIIEDLSCGAVNIPPVMEDESDDEDGSAEEETEIVSFNGHRWALRRHLEFQVVWADADVTWEPLAKVNDCAAMEVYLAHHDLDDPLILSKCKFLHNTKLEAINEFQTS
ncbi:hypothetical protein B0H16DRAFT_1831906 [Mycena metata]|uniref:Chromo domain-containing protein n=1 Tax=Mycena metata TaxID=1033252 RepID=A0AAD7DYA7_9AGAR|nr:hypothetical protein B0H16DRAFT_1831906 [Mycena metata]